MRTTLDSAIYCVRDVGKVLAFGRRKPQRGMGTKLIAVALVILSGIGLAGESRGVGQEETTRASGAADSGQQASESGGFTGEKTAWHGFDRYDFLMDEANLTIKQIRAAPDEKNGIKGQVKGQLRCVVVVPKEAAPGKPWSWRGYYFDHEPQAEVELLKRGFHIGFVLIDAGKQWDAWYKFLTETHGLSKKPAFIGMSRGGRNAYTWATANPDKVSCIYADNPAVSRESLMKLGDLAQRDVPLLHVCGSLDPILGNHTLPVESLYQQLGGRISVMIKDGVGHHPHSLRDPTPIADFIVRSLQPAGGAAPAFAGNKSKRTSFYGVENSYRDFPKEGMYITCRGPWFSESYDRYEFKPDGVNGTISVIAPKKAASGMPWVLRADFVTRDQVIDLALLDKGFHIVTGPVGTNANGPELKPWNALYEYLAKQGFSRKAVMEGAGGAAGDAYAWAIANSDKVCCIYGENPMLRSNMSKAQPLDNLAALAKAGVPLLHVCGSLDPWLKSQTRVAEKRYQELGGQITVIVREGEGHYPLAPKDRQPVMEFIVKCAAAGN
jgi:pimeloyl-ACP methyl ester carboxylesterase